MIIVKILWMKCDEKFQLRMFIFVVKTWVLKDISIRFYDSLWRIKLRSLLTKLEIKSFGASERCLSNLKKGVFSYNAYKAKKTVTV